MLEPLGMMNSLFLPYPSKRIVPTQQLASGEVLRGITHDPKARVLAEHAGNAGLFIDLEDSIKFVKMYLDKGKTANGQFLEEKNDRRAFARSNTTSKRRSIIGMGFEKRCDRSSSNSFHTGYTGTFLSIDLIDQTAFIFFSIQSCPSRRPS